MPSQTYSTHSPPPQKELGCSDKIWCTYIMSVFAASIAEFGK